MTFPDFSWVRTGVYAYGRYDPDTMLTNKERRCVKACKQQTDCAMKAQSDDCFG